MTFRVKDGISVNGIQFVDTSTNARALSATITSTADASGANTGALQVTGGGSLGGSLYVAGVVTATSFVGAFAGTVSGTATSANNLTGGATGSLPYQSSGGTTAMLGISSTAGYVLSSTGSVPQWSSLSSLGAGSATTATNIAGGTAGQLPYQSAAGTTAFTGPGTAGQILVSNGTSAPAYQNTLTLAGTTASSSTTTGALVVAGGLGVGGNLNVGGTVTVGLGAAAVSSSNGDLTLAATGGNVTTTNIVIISNSSGVTSAATGALRVAGGVGVGGNLYVAGVVTATSFTGSLTGNADTATSAGKWTTARTFTFGGDLSGSMVVDGSQNVTFTATIAADSIALGTDTTGNYVAGISAGTAIAVSGSGAENATVTITNLGVSSLTAGGGVTVSASTGSVTLGFTTSTLVQTASNLAGGTAGQLAYQSAAGTTAFTGPGTAGQVLVSNGTSAPAYQNTLTLAGTTVSSSTTTGALVVAGGLGVGGDLNIGGTITAGSGAASVSSTGDLTLTATGGNVTTTNVVIISNTSSVTSAATGALRVAGGVGVGGGLFVGGTVTATSFVGAFSGAITGVATTATNIAGGAAGSLPYNSAAGTTAFLSLSGTQKSLLTAGASAPVYVTQVQAQSGTGSTTQATGQSLVVTGGGLGVTGDSYFANNLATGGTLSIGSASANTGTNTSNAIYTAGGAWVDKSLVVGGAAIFQGAVSFQGTATYVYSTQTLYSDNLVQIHAPGGSTPSSHTWTTDDGLDVGHIFHYYKTTDKDAFLGWKNGSTYLEYWENGTESSGVYTGSTWGTFRTGAVKLVGGTSNAGNTSTGDLTVLGGVGVAGGLYVGGTVTATSFVGAFAGTVSGNADTATKWATPRTFTFGGDLSGSMVVDGSQNVTFTATIAADSVALGTDTTGNYVAGVSAGTAIAVSGSGSENATVTITNLGVGSLTAGTGIATNGSTGTVTLTNVGVTSLAGTAPIAVSASTGSVTISLTTASTYVANATKVDTVAQTASANYYVTFVDANNATAAQEVVGTTSTFTINPATGAVSGSSLALTRATASSSTTTGALVVTGGAGIGGDLNVGGTISVGTGAAVLGSTGDLTLTATGGNVTTTNIVVISNTTGVTSAATGALRVAGGVGVGGNLYVAGVVTATTFVGNLTGTITGSASSVANSLTIGSGLSGGSFNGSSAVTITNLGVTSIAGTAPIAVSASTGSVTVSLTTASTYAGNAVNAEKWLTARTITLGGDLTGSVSIDGSAGVTLNATIAADSVALGTDTTGNYVSGISAGTAIAVSGSGSENATVTITNLGVGSLTGGGGVTVSASTGSVTLGFTTSTLVQTASNLAGGTAGQLHYQSAAGTSAFAGPGTAGQILVSAGAAAPTYTSTSSIYVNSSVFAEDLRGGTAGQLAYQSAADTTAFVGPGTAGQLLMSAGASAPVYTSTSSIYVNRAVTADNLVGGSSISGNLTVTGNLTVQGTTTAVNSTVTNISDPIITIGGGAAGAAPTTDDGKDRGIAFQWHNGTAAKVGFFGFDDSTGYLAFVPDATITNEVVSGSFGDIQATNFRGALVGNADTATTAGKWTTARTITLGGDLTGSVSIDGSAGVTLNATIAADSVALGTDTTGNYVGGISAGTAIAVSGSGAENATVTITNLGVSSLTGTANRVTVSSSTGSVTLNLPQDFSTTASVQLGSLGIGTAASGTSGEIRATNEITAYYSDRRLKENVKVIDNAVTKVLSLNGITYTPNELAESFGYDRNVKLVGLFADEVEAILPEATRPAPFDQDENGNSKSGENYKTIQYEKLVPLLIEAIKEQQQQIAQLYDIINNTTNK